MVYSLLFYATKLLQVLELMLTNCFKSVRFKAKK